MNRTFWVPYRWELHGTLILDAPTRAEAIPTAYGPGVQLPDDEAVGPAPPPEKEGP